MENIQQINEENNKNILEGTLLDNILQQHNVGIVINEKVYADRKKADGRDDWVKKRDTIVSNLQHEINYFNLKDEEKRKAYLDYWGKEKSLNKDRQLPWLNEEDTIGKYTYNRRLVKEVWSYTSKVDENKPTRIDSKGKEVKNWKRIKDELLGYEIDIMIGQVPLLGRILNTKINPDTKEVEIIKKKLTDDDGNQLLDKEGNPRTANTWINNTIKSYDGSPFSEEELIKFLPSLKRGFEGDNMKTKFQTIVTSMKNTSSPTKNTSSTTKNESSSEQVEEDKDVSVES